MLFLAIFIYFNFFSNHVDPDELTKKEKQSIKRMANSEDYILEQLNVSDLEGLKTKYKEENKEYVITGRGVRVYELDGKRKEDEVTFNINFSKKNGVYSETINSSDSYLNSFQASTSFKRLLTYGSYGFSDEAEETALKHVVNFDYGYLIKASVKFGILKLYFDDEKTDSKVINNSTVFIEIDEKDTKKVKSFTKNGVIGIYNSLEEAVADSKNNPVPIEEAISKNYPKKSRGYNIDPKKLVLKFETKNFYGCIIRQSDIFYRLELWNKSNISEKPDFIYKNGVLEGSSDYLFDQNNKTVKLIKEQILEITDRFYTDKRIIEYIEN